MREECWYLLEVAALTGFLVTQPVLDTFGRSPETFIARGASRPEIIAFALAVAALPALAAWLLALAARLGGPARRRLAHRLAIASLVGLVAARVLDHLVHPYLGVVVGAGLVAGLAGGHIYRRASWMRLYLRVASVAPLAFASIFLVASPTSDLVLGHAVGAADVDVPSTAPSVLFIVLDQLPTASLLDGHGHVDADLYPNIARLASGSTWYRNETTVAPWTNMAVPAILSGDLPISQNTAPIASNYPHNLFTLLGRSYDLNVSEPWTALCPTSLCRRQGSDGIAALIGDAAGVARDVRPGKDEAFMLEQRINPDRPADFEEFVRTIAAPGKRPRLDYVHLLLPHDPWYYLPNGVRYPAPDLPTGMFYAVWGGEHSAAVGRQRHLLQVQLTDRLVGRALDRLEKSGRYDDTLIVLTADHGVGFTSEEPWRGASAGNYEQIMWTPLFVKAPGQRRGRIDDRNAWSVDVLPTVADILGVQVPHDWKQAGHSLVAPGEVRDPSDKVLFPWMANTLVPSADGLVHVDGNVGFRRLRAWSAASPGDELRVWRQGTYGALVGTRPEDHHAGAQTSYRGWLADPEAYTDVDLMHDPPVHLTGAVTVDGPSHPTIAVAVNGVIGGWGPTASSVTEMSYSFWTLVPDSLLHDGGNDVRFYAVSGPPDDPVLAPVPMSAG